MRLFTCMGTVGILIWIIKSMSSQWVFPLQNTERAGFVLWRRTRTHWISSFQAQGGTGGACAGRHCGSSNVTHSKSLRWEQAQTPTHTHARQQRLDRRCSWNEPEHPWLELADESRTVAKQTTHAKHRNIQRVLSGFFPPSFNLHFLKSSAVLAAHTGIIGLPVKTSCHRGCFGRCIWRISWQPRLPTGTRHMWRSCCWLGRRLTGLTASDAPLSRFVWRDASRRALTHAFED